MVRDGGVGGEGGKGIGRGKMGKGWGIVGESRGEREGDRDWEEEEAEEEGRKGKEGRVMLHSIQC